MSSSHETQTPVVVINGTEVTVSCAGRMQATAHFVNPEQAQNWGLNIEVNKLSFDQIVWPINQRGTIQ